MFIIFFYNEKYSKYECVVYWSGKLAYCIRNFCSLFDGILLSCQIEIKCKDRQPFNGNWNLNRFKFKKRIKCCV